MAKTSQERFDSKFDTVMLEMTIVALFSNVNNTKFVSNCYKLFNSFDPSSYIDDYEKDFRIFFIKKILGTIIEHKVTSRTELFAALNLDGKYSDSLNEVYERLRNAKLSPTELDTVDKAISDQLRYGIVLKKAKSLNGILQDIEGENYTELKDEIDKLEGSVDDLQRTFRDVRESLEESKYDMDLAGDDSLSILQEIIDDERDPSAKIKTGVQHVNAILNGGFEKGRLYMALGVAKGFKSGFLLNCAIYAKKYNRFKTKDPHKRPVIVYLTMENTTKETMKRIACYSFGNKFRFGSYDARSLQDLLISAKVLDRAAPVNEGEASIEIKYRKNNTVSAMDIRGILEDLEKDGKECVFLIVDYLMRMKPEKANRNGDLRLDLGTICNDLSDLAKERDIPVLSASQMNREALKTMENSDGSPTGKFAAARNLNGSQVGESIDILRNVDFAFVLSIIQNVTRNESTNEIESKDRWLTFKSIASRFETPDFDSISIRFAAGNDLRLLEDINAPKPESVIGGNTPQEAVNSTQKKNSVRRM